MVDLGMHLADIVQNSIRAKATRIEIAFLEENETSSLLFMVTDNGKGIPGEDIRKVEDPFFTTRTTRKIGLGIPLLKMTSEQSGGWCEVISIQGKGTVTKALYVTSHTDCLPLGDIAGYFVLLLIANPHIHFRFIYSLDKNLFLVDSEELKDEGITISANAEMAEALKEYINTNLEELFRYRLPDSYLTSY